MTAPKFFGIFMLVFELMFMVLSFVAHGVERSVYFVGGIVCLGVIFVLASIDISKESNNQ